MRRGAGVGALMVLVLWGCGTEGMGRPDREPAPTPFAREVVSFEPGTGAGFGQEQMPDVVLGAPHGGATSQGSTDVVSLGVGGQIVLELGEPLEDGAGPDLVVFENPFRVGGGAVFAEPGRVGVSADGERWFDFPCDPALAAPNGCAGYEPVLAGEDNGIDATQPPGCGGDVFDLSTLEERPAVSRFVRITDVGTLPAAAGVTTAGFDLDAVAVVAR